MQTSSWKLGLMTLASGALAAVAVACGEGRSGGEEAQETVSAIAPTPAQEEDAQSPGTIALPPMPPSPTTATSPQTSSPASAPTPDFTPVISGVPSPTTAASATAVASPVPTSVKASGYSSDIVMWDIFAAPGHPSEATLLALAEARKNRDVSQVPIILEMVRFVSSSEVVSDMAATLEELTGQNFGAGLPDWQRWSEWLGRNAAEYRPPEQYRQWKANLYSAIHPRLGAFLSPEAGPVLIDLTEVVWGGVAPDGIPDIQDPEVLTADQAGYLSPGDRVFGVSIGDEHRAYPLRVVNAHEMANDVLGGEPISLTY